jgi:hypothetical protein
LKEEARHRSLKIYDYLIQWLLAGAAVIVLLVLSAGSVSAQNVMHLRIDTVTAKPGAKVDVRVLYTFTSTHAHKIDDFDARFVFDTSESRLDTLNGLFPYIMNGAASFPNFDTTWSYTGLLGIGDTEIDLTDSVLFTIRMILDSNADTAWIRWDSNWYHGYGLALFKVGGENVDSVTLEDGWIRSSKPPSSVQSVSAESALLRMYPNPARDHITIDAPGSTDDAVIDVYDAVGRLSFEGSLVLGGWQIPSELQPGAYEVVLNGSLRTVRSAGMLIVAPQ